MKYFLALLCCGLIFTSCEQPNSSSSKKGSAAVTMESYADAVEFMRDKAEYARMVEVIDANGLHDEFMEDEEVTVFAPTNSGFDALPQGAYDELLKNKEIAARVIYNHIISGKLDSQAVMTREEIRAWLGDAELVSANNSLKNGYVHGINRVLLNAAGPEGKPEGKEPEGKEPEQQQEQGQEGKPEQQEQGQEGKPEQQQEQGQEGKPEQQQEQGQEGKPEGKEPEGKPEQQQEQGQEGKPEQQQEQGQEGKPEQKPEEQQETKPEGKPEQQETKPEGKPEQKPEQQQQEQQQDQDQDQDEDQDQQQD